MVPERYWRRILDDAYYCPCMEQPGPTRPPSDVLRQMGLPAGITNARNAPRKTGAPKTTGAIRMFNKKTVIALSVAAMAASTVALPAAAAHLPCCILQ